MLYEVRSERKRAKYVNKYRKRFYAELEKQLDPVMFAIKSFNTPEEVIAAIPTLMKTDGMYATFQDLYKETGSSFAEWIYTAAEKKYVAKSITKGLPELKFTWSESMANYVLNEVGIYISTILMSSGVQALRLVQLTVAQALDEGLSIPNTMKLLEKRIPIEWRKVSRWRSELIARTEVLTASNKGVMLGADSMESELGIVSMKQWSGRLDGRIREDHRIANGQTVLRTIPFQVGGAAMMQPGDPNGGASQRCNCRCSALIIVDGQALLD